MTGLGMTWVSLRSYVVLGPIDTASILFQDDEDSHEDQPRRSPIRHRALTKFVSSISSPSLATWYTELREIVLEEVTAAASPAHIPSNRDESHLWANSRQLPPAICRNQRHRTTTSRSQRCSAMPR